MSMMFSGGCIRLLNKSSDNIITACVDPIILRRYRWVHFQRMAVAHHIPWTVQWIFTRQIRKWFQEDSRKDGRKLEDFCRAFLEKDAAAVEAGFTSYLRKTISIRDTSVRKEKKENFYQGILLGLLGYMGWKVRSNAEAGDGYSDIIVEVGELSGLDGKSWLCIQDGFVVPCSTITLHRFL